MTIHLPLYAEVGSGRLYVIKIFSEMFFVFVAIVFLDFASRDVDVVVDVVVVVVFGVGVAVVCLASPAG